MKTLYQRYLAERRDGASAQCAWRIVRNQSRVTGLDWSHDRRGNQAATIAPLPGGLKAVVKVRPDTDGDSSYLGEWSDTWKPGAIAHIVPEHGVTRGCAPSAFEYRYRYFIPETNVAESRAFLRTYMARHAADCEARSYAMRDYNRARTLGSDWAYVGVVVTVFHESTGVELGSGSLWGIESDSGDEYFSEVARDLLSEALTEANTTRAKLCPA